ncbi:MAG TPA: ROK family protein [Erysipelothrix sp.]
MSYLVFDIGGTSVKYAVYHKNELLNQDAFLTPSTWTEMKEALKSVLLKFSQDYEFEGVAISAPGSTNIEKGVIEGVSAIDYLHHFPIREELEGLFNLPVSLENDANCAALAELWQGVAQGEENILFVVIGTGIGGAVIIDGKLQRGSHLFGGEFGLMLLEPNVSFSLNATPVHMAEKYCKRKGLASDAVSGEEVFALAQTDEIALEEVTRFYDYLAQGLFNLQFITDPNMIVLGGGVSQYEPLIPELQKRLDKRMKTANITDFTFNIKACHFKNNANLLGAVYSFMQQHNIE